MRPEPDDAAVSPAPRRGAALILWVAASILGYVATFPLLYPSLGPGTFVLYLGPIVLAAVKTGRGGAIGVSLAYPVATTVGLNLAGVPGWLALVDLGGLTGIPGFVAVAWILGHFVDLRTRIQHQSEALEVERGRLEVEVAARKTAEELLETQIARHAGLLQAQSDLGEGVIVSDGVRIHYANPAIAEMLGVSRTELLTRPLADFVPPEAREAFVSLARARDAGVSQKRFDLTLVPASGAPIQVAVAAKANPDGTIIAIVRDITEARRVGEHLEKQVAMLARAEAIAHMGSFEWDIVKDEVVASSQLRRIAGVGPDEAFTLESSLSHIHPDDLAAVRTMLHEALTTRNPQQIECRIQHPTGGTRVLLMRGDVECDASGIPIRLVGTALDVTEQRRAQEIVSTSEERSREITALRELNELKSRFISTAAHELGGPLTPIRLQLHLLRTRHAAGLTPEQERALAIIGRNVERVGSLARDVLDGARLQAGRLALAPAATDLQAIVFEAVDSLQDAADQAGIRLEAHNDEALPVTGDARRLGQVMHNLLANALKFTPEGGLVVVDTRVTNGQAVVLVRDTGAGFRPEDAVALFQPFSQLHQELKRGGTGLGLYICRGIVEEHGGRMWCDSHGPGLGATFGFTVPLRFVGPTAHVPS